MNNRLRKHQLVFTISKSEDLGVIFEPYIVKITESNEFSLSYRRINMATIRDYSLVLTDEQYQLIEIMDQYSEEILVKRFGRDKKQKARDFFANLSAQAFQNVIRPYIERRLLQCLQILKDHQIPLYFKGRKKDAISETKIDLMYEPADVIFNFIREEGQTRYFLSIKHREQDIILTSQDYLFITHQPCWLLLGNCIYAFNDEIDSKKLIPFFTKNYIEIPPNSEKKYFETFILNAIKHFRVNYQGFTIKDFNPAPKALLSLSSYFDQGLFLQLTYYYGNTPFKANESFVPKVFLTEREDEYIFEKVRRDPDWEKEITKFLTERGLQHKQGALYELKDKENKGDGRDTYTVIEWLNAHQTELAQKNIEVDQSELEETYFIGQPDLRFDVKKKRDWFDIYGTVYFNGYAVPFIQLRDHILNGNREYRLPDGSIALIPEEWFATYENVLNFGKPQGESIWLKKHHFPLIYSINKRSVDNQLKAYKNIDVSNINYEAIPEEINAELRPYQLQGYSWMNYLYENGLGGCLADDMGLGKTLQVLAFLTKLKKEQAVAAERQNKEPVPEGVQLNLFDREEEETAPSGTSIIVMPLSLIHNWENEIRKFAPSLRYLKYVGYKRDQNINYFADFDVVLTTYGIIRNDINVLRSFPFLYVILDESQMIKNPGSKIYRTVKQINSSYRLVLTGTPVENSLTDLWAQMSFINNGLLGNYRFFKRCFVSPIERGNDEAKKQELHKLIEPFVLRRTKEAVADDLPDLSVKTHFCEMTDDQRKLYEEEKSSIRNMILEKLEENGKEKASFAILNGLMRLRLIANHPLLSGNETIEDSGKFTEVIRSIDKLIPDNRKVLLYSSFVKHLNLFRDYFEKYGIQYSYLTGNMNEKQRQNKIKDFQDKEDIQVFLISIKAGGTGLNLTSADYVFITDPWWNPAVENQAINRTHRIGQHKNVLAYKFITKDSIEEKILNLQEQKSYISEEFMNNKNPFKDFTEEDIKHLLA